MNHLVYHSSEVAFFKADLNIVVERFVEWQKGIFHKHGWLIDIERRVDGVDGLAQALMPIVNAPITRHLFLTTKSGWVGYFDNGPNGTDSSGVVSVLSESLRIEAVRLVLSEEIPTAPNCPEFFRGTVAHRALIFSHHCSARESDLTMFSVNDGGRWKHDSYGINLDLLSFDTSVTREHPLNVERLVEICSLFGLHPLSRDWYGNDAVLVSKTRPN